MKQLDKVPMPGAALSVPVYWN